jgi:hypothetical protein
VINEVDYDQPNTDSTEFIEIYNAANSVARLDGVAVVLVNGANQADYGRVVLGGTLGSHEFAVVASLLVTVPAGVAVFPFATQDDNLQNGAPDAVGLLDTETHALLDALAYEGAVSGVTLTGEPGTFEFVEGTATGAFDDFSPTRSLVRIPDGTDSDNAVLDWLVTLTPTPGGANQ